MYESLKLIENLLNLCSEKPFKALLNQTLTHKHRFDYCSHKVHAEIKREVGQFKTLDAHLNRKERIEKSENSPVHCIKCFAVMVQSEKSFILQLIHLVYKGYTQNIIRFKVYVS